MLIFDVARRELHYRLPFEEGAAGEEYRAVSIAAKKAVGAKTT